MRNAVVYAAVAAGRAAFQAGQNVEAALTAAGYARHVIDGVQSYFSREGYEAGSPSYQEGMSSSSSTKRQRRYSSRTVPVAKSVKKYVKATVDRLLDDKYNSATVTDSAVSASGTVVGLLLPGIQQGTTDTTRIGNHIRVKHITVNGVIADTVPNRGRVIICWDRQPNGALPAFGEILSSPTVDGMYNHDNVVGCGGQRFTVLYDSRFAINPNIVATQTYHHWKYSTHSQNKVVTYDGNAGAITDLVTNNLVVAYVASSSTLDLGFTYEVCFTDA